MAAAESISDVVGHWLVSHDLERVEKDDRGLRTEYRKQSLANPIAGGNVARQINLLEARPQRLHEL